MSGRVGEEIGHHTAVKYAKILLEGFIRILRVPCRCTLEYESYDYTDASRGIRRKILKEDAYESFAN